MNTIQEHEVLAPKVYFKDNYLCVVLEDDRIIQTPISIFPRLQNGTSAQRNNFEFNPPDFAIHWPDLDEDILIKTLLAPCLNIPPKLLKAKPFEIRQKVEKKIRHGKKKQTA
jgi:hypothetical protein